MSEKLNCPACYQLGVTSILKLYQINLKEATYLCMNSAQCLYPQGYGWTVINRSLDQMVDDTDDIEEVDDTDDILESLMKDSQILDPQLLESLTQELQITQDKCDISSIVDHYVSTELFNTPKVTIVSDELISPKIDISSLDCGFEIVVNGLNKGEEDSQGTDKVNHYSLRSRIDKKVDKLDKEKTITSNVNDLSIAIPNESEVHEIGNNARSSEIVLNTKQVVWDSTNDAQLVRPANLETYGRTRKQLHNNINAEIVKPNTTVEDKKTEKLNLSKPGSESSLRTEDTLMKLIQSRNQLLRPEVFNTSYIKTEKLRLKLRNTDFIQKQIANIPMLTSYVTKPKVPSETEKEAAPKLADVIHPTESTENKGNKFAKLELIAKGE